MLNKKLISLLLVVGLCSSATMHPIWGFDWLFGSSNQTSQHTDNNHKKYALIGAGVLGTVVAIGLVRYWLTSKLLTKQERNKKRVSFANNPHFKKYDSSDEESDDEEEFSSSAASSANNSKAKALASRLPRLNCGDDSDLPPLDDGPSSSGSHATATRPQEPEMVNERPNMTASQWNALGTQQRNSRWPIKLVGNRGADAAPVVPANYDDTEYSV